MDKHGLSAYRTIIELLWISFILSMFIFLLFRPHVSLDGTKISITRKWYSKKRTYKWNEIAQLRGSWDDLIEVVPHSGAYTQIHFHELLKSEKKSLREELLMHLDENVKTPKFKQKPA